MQIAAMPLPILLLTPVCSLREDRTCSLFLLRAIYFWPCIRMRCMRNYGNLHVLTWYTSILSSEHMQSEELSRSSEPIIGWAGTGTAVTPASSVEREVIVERSQAGTTVVTRIGFSAEQIGLFCFQHTLNLWISSSLSSTYLTRFWVYVNK